MRFIIISGFCLILLNSCKRHKMLQQAIQTEQQGRSSVALKMYFDLCNSFSDDAACESFRRLVDEKVDSMVMMARSAAAAGNCDQSSCSFGDAEEIMRKYPGHQIDMIGFRSARSSTMERCYGVLLAMGEEGLMKGEFEQALDYTSQVPAHYTGYERAQQISQLARLSILYELAEKSRQQGEWSDAYSSYSAIYEEDDNFRDVKQRMEECLSHLRISMAYVIAHSSVGDESLYRRTETLVRQELKSLMGDRIQILERTDLEILLEQHRLQMQASFDEETGASLGLLERASFFLTAEWVGLDFFESPARRESCDCSAVFGIPNDCADCYRTYTTLAAKGELKIQVLAAGTGEVFITQLVSCEPITKGLRHEFVLNSKGEKLKSSGKLSVMQDPGDIPILSRNQLQEQLLKQLSAQVAERVYHVFED